jgi:hypothetical protein
MQLIYQYTTLLRSWSSLQRMENRKLFTEVSTWLEDTSREIIIQHRWHHSLRIGSHRLRSRYNFMLVSCMKPFISLFILWLMNNCVYLSYAEACIMLKPVE